MNNGGDNDHSRKLARSLFGTNKKHQPTYTPQRGAMDLSKLIASLKPLTPPAPYSPPPLKKATPLVKFFNSNQKEASLAQVQHSNDVTISIKQTLQETLIVSKTSSVPRREDIGLNNGKLIESAVLYIDIRKSTSITTNHTDDVAAKIYKAFHESMVSIARYQGRGHVRGFAGDKIMVLFDNSNDAVKRAVDCAMWMQSFIEQKLSPTLQSAYKHPIECGIGIDYGKMTAVRAGTKNNNDVVWAGSPANKASKLADSTPGGMIDISYQAMTRIKATPELQRRFNLGAAKSLTVKEGEKFIQHYRLAKLRYDLS